MEIDIPDNIFPKITDPNEKLKRVKQEIAILLFEQERFTLGQASHFVGMNQLEFQRLLASRKIPIHYDIAEFREDVKSLKANNWR